MESLEKFISSQASKGENLEDLKNFVSFTKNLFTKYHLQPEEIQWKILVNHLDEMIYRSKSKEKLPEMDINIFSELPEQSLLLAKKIVNYQPNLEENEKYLLAVHVASIMENQ